MTFNFCKLTILPPSAGKMSSCAIVHWVSVILALNMSCTDEMSGKQSPMACTASSRLTGDRRCYFQVIRIASCGTATKLHSHARKLRNCANACRVSNLSSRLQAASLITQITLLSLAGGRRPLAACRQPSLRPQANCATPVSIMQYLQCPATFLKHLLVLVWTLRRSECWC